LYRATRNKVCSKKFWYRVLAIFFFGYSIRLAILSFGGVNVIIDILHPVSAGYWLFIALITKLSEEWINIFIPDKLFFDSNSGSSGSGGNRPYYDPVRNSGSSGSGGNRGSSGSGGNRGSSGSGGNRGSSGSGGNSGSSGSGGNRPYYDPVRNSGSSGSGGNRPFYDPIRNSPQPQRGSGTTGGSVPTAPTGLDEPTISKAEN